MCSCKERADAPIISARLGPCFGGKNCSEHCSDGCSGKVWSLTSPRLHLLRQQKVSRLLQLGDLLLCRSSRSGRVLSAVTALLELVQDCLSAARFLLCQVRPVTLEVRFPWLLGILPVRQCQSKRVAALIESCFLHIAKAATISMEALEAKLKTLEADASHETILEASVAPGFKPARWIPLEMTRGLACGIRYGGGWTLLIICSRLLLLSLSLRHSLPAPWAAGKTQQNTQNVQVNPKLVASIFFSITPMYKPYITPINPKTPQLNEKFRRRSTLGSVDWSISPCSWREWLKQRCPRFWETTLVKGRM